MSLVSFSDLTSFARISLAGLSQPRYQKGIYAQLTNVPGFDSVSSDELQLRFNLGMVSESILRANVQHALLEHQVKEESARVTCTTEYVLQALVSVPRPAPQQQHAVEDALMRLAFIVHAQWCHADTNPHAVRMVLSKVPEQGDMRDIVNTIKAFVTA